MQDLVSVFVKLMWNVEGKLMHWPPKSNKTLLMSIFRFPGHQNATNQMVYYDGWMLWFQWNAHVGRKIRWLQVKTPPCISETGTSITYYCNQPFWAWAWHIFGGAKIQIHISSWQIFAFSFSRVFFCASRTLFIVRRFCLVSRVHMYVLEHRST